jgi:hypothetical protein
MSCWACCAACRPSCCVVVVVASCAWATVTISDKARRTVFICDSWACSLPDAHQLQPRFGSCRTQQSRRSMEGNSFQVRASSEWGTQFVEDQIFVGFALCANDLDLAIRPLDMGHLHSIAGRSLRCGPPVRKMARQRWIRSDVSPARPHLSCRCDQAHLSGAGLDIAISPGDRMASVSGRHLQTICARSNSLLGVPPNHSARSAGCGCHR